MNWVTALPPGAEKGYNAFLVIVERYHKTPIFLPCHKDDTAMDTALLMRNRVISHTGLFKNIISGRDPKFTCALSTNLHKLLGTKLSFLTAYHPQTDGLAERMIQALEGMIRRFCAYGLEFKHPDGFTHDWCTLIPELELAYKTSIHSSTGKTPEMLEKGWNPKLSVDTLKKDLVDMNSTASSFNLFLEKKLKDSFAGPLIIKDLHGTNAVQVEISGELENKHLTFPVGLVKHYTSSYKELFPFRNETPLEVPSDDQSEEKKVLKVSKERRLRGKNEREYLVRYRNPHHEDEWIVAEKIPDSERFLRRFRHKRRPIPQGNILIVCSTYLKV
ncbi:hypothetical protein O181_108940 [Austropuccinia psidii MF-1]|uniref:Integrase catalytic domain-containing protein n=1 Tax=Austropuccinia psidii MF-1 TaxID=1389203 RepID=A0A9Q3PQ26_9BASI|nr:hypothetical protein [Austropuccinia psidii MF-1]